MLYDAILLLENVLSPRWFTLRELTDQYFKPLADPEPEWIRILFKNFLRGQEEEFKRRKTMAVCSWCVKVEFCFRDSECVCAAHASSEMIDVLWDLLLHPLVETHEN